MHNDPLEICQQTQGECSYPERRYIRVAFAPCLAVVYTFLPIKVLSLVFRGVISSLPPLLHRKLHNALPL
jgi:hypothetical protein